MAASRSWGIWAKCHRILPQIFMSKEYISLRINSSLDFSQQKAESSLKNGRWLISWAQTLFNCRRSIDHDLSSATQNCEKFSNLPTAKVYSDCRVRHYSQSTPGQPSQSGGPSKKPDKERPLRLMDFAELVWPHPLKTLRNFFFTFLIGSYYDNSFTSASFLRGAKQAVGCISNLISQGNFDSLEGLVTREAIRECSRSYMLLSERQRKFLDVEPKDLFYCFIYEIGMIFDDETDKRFVEITAVFQGIHNHGEMKERPTYLDELRDSQDKIFVCNYRFIREFTKGVEDDWIVNKLNHFSPKEFVQNTSLFRR